MSRDAVMPTEQQEELINRIRAVLPAEAPVREVPMFGGRAFMVNDRMIVSAGKRGDLLIRSAAERHDQLLAHPGASQAEMGTGRSMGPGWITASAASIADDEGLGFWLDVALDYNQTVTGQSR